MSRKLQLHQFLSKTGEFGSKDDVYRAISSGKISVNGRVVRKGEFELRPTTEVVTFKEKPLTLKAQDSYFVVHKPAGYLSSKLTPQDLELGKKSVFELLKVPDSLLNTLFSVGRLDEDSSGLLLITNDGQFSRKVIHDDAELWKVYEVELAAAIRESQIRLLERGVEIELEENGRFSHYKTKPCTVQLVDRGVVVIAIREGKKRQIRRMFEAVGNRVVSLKRIAIGGLSLDEVGLKVGQILAVDKNFLEGRIFSKK